MQAALVPTETEAREEEAVFSVRKQEVEILQRAGISQLLNR